MTALCERMNDRSMGLDDTGTTGSLDLWNESIQYSRVAFPIAEFDSDPDITSVMMAHTGSDQDTH